MGRESPLLEEERGPRSEMFVKPNRSEEFRIRGASASALAGPFSTTLEEGIASVPSRSA